MTVRVVVIDALWYRAAGSEPMRLVVVRGFPGHERDDVFVSTDPKMTPKSIIETFALRWSLEVTFHDCKGKLGFEDPQSSMEHAVERTAPMALWLHTLVVVWYVTRGQHSRFAHLPARPWYSKSAPAFSDMLAALRRSSWRELLSVPCADVQTVRKKNTAVGGGAGRITDCCREAARALRSARSSPASNRTLETAQVGTRRAPHLLRRASREADLR